ncbi:MAG: serine hydrolase [bacterium]|nr:serine hydrolase [bacterium]
MMKWGLSLLLGLLVSCSHSQSEGSSETHGNEEVSVLDSLGLDMNVARNEEYRFQFLATSIKEGKVNKSVSYGTGKYYYPASLVKLPASLVLLEILNEKDISLDAIPVFDTVQACGSVSFVEISQQRNISFRKMLKELLVASDNHFYNAIYHFITPQELNKRLAAKGFKGVKIYRAFTGCDLTDHLRTYPCKVYDDTDLSTVLYEQAPTVMDSSILEEVYEFTEERLFGSKHENADGDIVDGPYDLNFHIEIPLEQVHAMMLSLYFPRMQGNLKDWNIRSKDLLFLQDLLGMYPSEIRTKHNLEDFEYKYVRNIEGHAEGRTFNKLGLSYGFASETVYVPMEGFANGILLSYSVYVNSNDIVNDGEYDYETVARPFAEALFKRVLEWHKN